MIDFDRVRAVAFDAREAMLKMEAEPWRNAKSIFPQVWCEWGSIAVAEVLAVNGLGEWTFVSAKLPDSLSGHAWLELRDDEGRCVFTIDITLDQFDEWDAPFVGTGRTPALTKFSELDYVGPWHEWPEALRSDTFAQYADKMVEHMRAA